MTETRKTAGAGWLLYAVSRAGKTACVAPMFDGRGTVIEFQPDDHRVMQTVYDCVPGRVLQTQKLEDALKELSKLKAADGPVVINDTHYMISSYGQRGAEFWKRIEKALIGIGEVTAELSSKGAQVFVTCLEQGPRDSSRGSLPGGPMLPGMMTQSFAGLFHTVTRMVAVPAGLPGHNYWLDFGSDAAFCGGSRDLASKIKLIPPCPSEVLRFAGVRVVTPHLEQHDKLVEKLAGTVFGNYQEIVAAGADSEIGKACNGLLHHLVAKGMSVGKARQIVTAGLTRGVLRYSQTVF